MYRYTSIASKGKKSRIFAFSLTRFLLYCKYYILRFTCKIKFTILQHMLLTVVRHNTVDA